MVILRVLADRHHSLEYRGSEKTSSVAYYVETTECRVAYRDCRAQSRKSTTVKRKQGRPKKQTEASEELPDMCAEHGLGKSSESRTVKRKRGRPKKQTQASFDRSEELPDMCAEHGLGKSSDVERKRIRLGEVLTLQQLGMYSDFGLFSTVLHRTS